ncbi:MAG: undecaprenyl-diphosphate phosphatase [Scytonema hyalinum WJT4-NPBG1]|jgi:undecaprenyl-diphosphatase|nr:undecaprenyl-diphosphate phosphatase [Scytonema hyalinum WJT4-NPBG1]
MTTILEAGSTQWYGLLYPVWGQLAQVAEIQNATAGGEANLMQQLIQAFILGLIQGITEFLPISSTAHLEVFTKAFGWELLGQKAFVATIQFGSVIAVLMYFRKDISQILTGSWKAFQQKDWQRNEWQLLVGIAIGTLPILVAGFLLKDVLNDENSLINSMSTIAIDSIVLAILLGAAEKFGSRERDFSALKMQDGLLIGLGQMLSLAPGVSRSGSTFTTGLFLGLQRQTAARFSFLLGIPALAIATIYQFLKEALGKIDLVVVSVGVLSTFVFSYISIAWLLRYLQTRNNWIFVWYRLAFGATILVAIATGLLKNT